MGVTAPGGIIVAPGGGPYWALGNGCRGGAPLQTVVGVEKGVVAPVAVTIIAPPGVTLGIVDD